jgi:hypothetical protein
MMQNRFYDRNTSKNTSNISTVISNKTVQLKDNRNLHTTQNKQISNLNTIQRVLLGTGDGTDDDRSNIETEAIIPNETVEARGDNRGRAIIQNFFVNGVNRADYVLKHYAVIKNGTRYQVPIKYFSPPSEVGVRNQVGWGRHTEYLPNNNQGNDVRGGQPEAFGGVDDLPHNQQITEYVETRRNQTLGREYAEENHNHRNATLNSIRSKKFALLPQGNGRGNAGTLSIVESNNDFGYLEKNQDGPFLNRGQAEMAGAVAIETNDLIDGVLEKDDLEQEIGRRIELARNAFHVANGVNAPLQNPFNQQAGVIAELIGMIADEVLAERGRRNAAAIEEELRLAAQIQQNKKKALYQKLVVLGLIAFFVFLYKVLVSSNNSQNKDEL